MVRPVHYGVSVGAPDLSHVLETADRIGTNTGYNEFMAQVIEHQNKLEEIRLKQQQKELEDRAKALADKAKKDQKDEKAAAKEDLAKPDASKFATGGLLGMFGHALGGVFSKAADLQMNGLERIIDIASRPNYAVASAIDVADQTSNIDKSRKGFHFNMPEWDWNDAKKIGGAAVKGFEGKNKTYFSHVIARQAKDDPNHTLLDNKVFQGVTGLGADIGLDPTSYMGFGIITKGLKVGSKEAKALEAAQAPTRALAEDISKLNIHLPDELPKNFIGPREKPVPLDAEEIGAMLGLRKTTVKGNRLVMPAATTRRAQQAHQARLYTELMPKLREAIKANPELHTDDTLKELDGLIKHHQAEFEKNLDDFGKQAYADAAKRFDENPKLWPTRPVGDNLLSDVEKSPTLWRSAKAFESERFVRGGSTTNKSFHDILGPGWQQDHRISEDFRSTAYDKVEELAQQDKTVKELKAANSIIYKRNLPPLKDALKRATEPAEKARIQKLIDHEEFKAKKNWKRQDLARASLFHKMLSDHILSGSGLKPELHAELTDLKAEEADLIAQAKGLSLDGETIPTRDELNVTVRASGDVAAGEATVSDQTRTMLDRLDTVQSRIKEIEGGGVGTFAKSIIDRPVGMPQDFKVTEDWLAKDIKDPEVKAYRDVVETEFEKRADDIYEQKVATFTRKAREDKLDELIPKNHRVRGMFGAGRARKSSGTGTQDALRDALRDPKITVDGKTVFKSDKNSIENLALITKADVSKAADLSHVLDPVPFIPKDAIDLTKWDMEGWLKSTKASVHPAHVAFDRVFKEQHGLSLEAATRLKNGTIKSVKDEVKTNTKGVPRQRLRVAAKQQALKEINDEIAGGKFRGIGNKAPDFHVGDPALEDVYHTSVENAKHEYATKAAAEIQANNGTVKGIETTLRELRQMRDTKVALHKEAYDEAVKTREAMADKLGEQVTLDMLENNLAYGRKYFQIKGAGRKLVDIPVPKILTAATEKMGGLPVLQSAFKLWGSMFRPASRLEPELNLARLRAQARTPDIIKHHVDDIRHTFSGFKPAERKDAMRSVLAGAPAGNHELYNATENYLNEMVPYFTGKVSVGEGESARVLKISDINNYLPDEFKLSTKDKSPLDSIIIKDGADIVRAMRRFSNNTDPMKMMWHTRIAIEQALSHKAMESTINGMFGVKRIIRKGPDKLTEPSEAEKLIESLHDNHGWVHVDQLGGDHYFAPETAQDIKKLLDMMKPAKVHEATKLYDKATRIWKATVTVYNPGYYTRNGIGEVMMGMFDGLSNPKWYTKAGNIIKYAMPDEVNETLKTLEPWKRHATTSQLGKKPVMTLAGGKQLTAEDVWVLYHDSGLKSGFISSEYDHYFPVGNNIKSTKAGQLASKVNDKVREKGEKFEDYFRLAHFMYRMGKSGQRDAQKAAIESAQYVRKYHFDYTDFTPFEKTTMLRVFPFYKWTRKALPLMAGMLFTNPGKVMLYPKTMQNLSVATGGTDPLQDNNGFFPNYEKLTPEWMQGLMAYPLGRDQEGNMTNMHMATPQFDTLSMIQNPVSTAVGMTNPWLKVPTEEALGRTLDPNFKMALDKSESKNPKFDEAQARKDHLMSTTPIGSLYKNYLKNKDQGDSVITEPGDGGPLALGGKRMDEKLLSFLVGLGFYENNDKSKKGEQMRQNFSKEG